MGNFVKNYYYFSGSRFRKIIYIDEIRKKMKSGLINRDGEIIINVKWKIMICSGEPEFDSWVEQLLARRLYLPHDQNPDYYSSSPL
jgi:hypothetical protein